MSEQRRGEGLGWKNAIGVFWKLEARREETKGVCSRRERARKKRLFLGFIILDEEL